jgi:hypothetical protein
MASVSNFNFVQTEDYMAAAACVVLMAMAANAEFRDDSDHRCPHTVFEVEFAVLVLHALPQTVERAVLL